MSDIIRVDAGTHQSKSSAGGGSATAKAARWTGDATMNYDGPFSIWTGAVVETFSAFVPLTPDYASLPLVTFTNEGQPSPFLAIFEAEFGGTTDFSTGTAPIWSVSCNLTGWGFQGSYGLTAAVTAMVTLTPGFSFVGAVTIGGLPGIFVGLRVDQPAGSSLLSGPPTNIRIDLACRLTLLQLI